MLQLVDALKTYAAISHAHLFSVWKQLKLPVFRPFTDSDQHSFQIFLCHIGVPTFSLQNKVTKVCPKYLLTFYQNLYSPYQRQIDVARTKSNDVHNYPGYKYECGRVSTIWTVIKSRTRPDLVAYWLACLATKPEDLGRFPGSHLLSVCVFSFLFNILMLNCFIY